MTHVVLSDTVEVEVKVAVLVSVKITVALASGGASTVTELTSTVVVKVGVAAKTVLVTEAVAVTVVGMMDSTTTSQTTLKGSFTGPWTERPSAESLTRALSAFLGSSMNLRRRSRRLGLLFVSASARAGSAISVTVGFPSEGVG